MTTIDLKHRWTDRALYSHTAEAADLRTAILAALAAKANLRDANLRDANLRGADLRGANLCGADLYGADLYGADLRDANLRDANLRGADLYGADLCGANLYGADLYGADLYGADLRGADLTNARLPGFQVPQEGTLTVWKKLRDHRLAKLLIPAEAARTATPRGRKCRAEFVDVLAIEDATGQPCATGESLHQSGFFYTVGQRITPDAYNADIREECQAGIHFFQTKEEAIAYN